MKRRTWVEVSEKALLHNVHELRRVFGDGVEVLAVIKGNAYGASIKTIVPITRDAVDWYGTDSLEEAILARSLCENNILILGYVSSADAAEVVKHNLTANVYSYDFALALSKVATGEKPAKIHVKVDTGLGRLGASPQDAIALVEMISKLPTIVVEGLFTHYASLADENGEEVYHEQLAAFHRVVSAVNELGIYPRVLHSASSGAAVLYESTRFNMVRLGIPFYGLWGRRCLTDAVQQKVDLKVEPTLSWKTTVINLKSVPAGSGFGYGHSAKVTRDTSVAVLGAGFYDGIDKRYGKTGHVLVRGQRARLLGSVAMTMCMVDVTGIAGVQIGDTATLIGHDLGEELSAYEFAEVLGTSTYEVLSRINPLLPRLLVE